MFLFLQLFVHNRQGRGRGQGAVGRGVLILVVGGGSDGGRGAVDHGRAVAAATSSKQSAVVALTDSPGGARPVAAVAEADDVPHALGSLPPVSPPKPTAPARPTRLTGVCPV